MANANDRVFDIANAVFEDVVIETATKSAEEFRFEVQAVLSDYVKVFYSQMFYKLRNFYTDFYDAKNLKLSEQYSAWKARQGGNLPDYYHLSGKLERYLLARDPFSDMGRPEAKFSKRGRGLSPKIQIDSKGKAQFKAGSGSRGYASDRQAFRQLVFTIDINLYPKLKGKSFAAIFDVMFKNGNPTEKMKFAVANFGRDKNGKVSKQPARPLLEPFLSWYQGTNLKHHMAEKLKVEI